MIRVFVGYDPREREGFHTFVHSLLKHAAEPVAITALHGPQRDGTNAFTYGRFLVPFLCDFSGRAVFVDGCDMLMQADIAELFDLAYAGPAVHVVKHAYVTKHARKYLGTEMEADNRDYPRKNWSSVIAWDCAHPLNRCLTPAYVAEHTGEHLHRFAWLEDELIGELPAEWNWLADEFGTKESAKLLHWTLGMPGFKHYVNAPMAEHWWRARWDMVGALRHGPLPAKEIA